MLKVLTYSIACLCSSFLYISSNGWRFIWGNDSFVSYRTIFCLACAVILGTQGQDWNQGKARKCWKVFFTIKTTWRWTLPPFMCELTHLPFVPLYIMVIGFAYREAPCVGVRSLWLSFSSPWEASKQFHCRRRDVSISWLDFLQVVQWYMKCRIQGLFGSS